MIEFIMEKMAKRQFYNEWRYQYHSQLEKNRWFFMKMTDTPTVMIIFHENDWHSTSDAHFH